jgi:hypothetical protein
MSLKNWITSMATGMFLERPAQKLTLAGHADQLKKSGHALRQQFGQVKGTDANRAQLRHIIGIERWAQSRLQTLLGEPLRDDEYDGYCPSAEAGWDALRVEFDETRAATLTLIEELDAARIDPAQTIPHNQYGKLSVLAWLRYIDQHANMEAKRIQ